ncbi:TPA: ABC transporter permease [Desulfurococcaceae archaeon]|nr:ABC transporter permease [Desulfurococcaceae archaeon]
MNPRGAAWGHTILLEKLPLIIFILSMAITVFAPQYSVPLWLLLFALGLKYNKQLTLKVASRLADAALVLLIVLIITVAMFGGLIAEIKKQMIEDEVKRWVMSQPQLVQKLGEKVKDFIKEQVEERIKAEGLDKPWYANLLYYLSTVVTLDMRSHVLRSNTGSQLVKDIIMERLPRTVLLFTTATVISALIGILLGLVAAYKRGSVVDKLVTVAALISASFPMWWIGMIMIEVFSYALGVFPSGGMTSVPPPSDPIAYVADVLYHMSLPLLTIVLVSVGGWAYVTRSILVGATKEDFVLAAKARGLAERTVLLRHVLRPSIPPILTMIALSLVASLSGAIITEIVFNWPGMGLLYWEAIETLDVPVILGLTYIFTLVFVIAMVILDVMYIVLDPRVRW